MANQTELAQLQGEHHAKLLEAQKLQRALDRKEQELADLQQAKEQLEADLDDLQQQKKKGDKVLNVRQEFWFSYYLKLNKALKYSKSSFLLSAIIRILGFV